MKKENGLNIQPPFDKEFGDYTLKMLKSKGQCIYGEGLCRDNVSIYDSTCKKCHEEKKKK